VRVALDAQNWAELKDLGELRSKDRRKIVSGITFEVNPATGQPVFTAGIEDASRDSLILRILRDWSLALPKTIDGLCELTIEQEKNLHAAIEPYTEALFGRNAPTRDNPVPTPPAAR
jgi:hypothetical protein